MKIENYIVENYQLLMDLLEKDLCKMGISYVRIDNEIHFLDKIIRFFDFEIDKREIISWGFSKIEVLNIVDRFSLVNFSFNDIDNYVPEKISFNDNKCYQRRNKSSYKNESNKVKQKLKRYLR